MIFLVFFACSKDENVVLLPQSGIMNPGFEYGDLSGWTYEGDTRVISSLDTIYPVEGRYMALLSTGLDTEHYHGSLSQTFTVKEEYSFLVFRWNILFEELQEHIEHQPQAYFRVTFTRENGSEQMLLFRNAAIISHEAGALAHFPGSLMPFSNEIFNNGYLTGWKDLVFNISQYQGEKVTIGFEAMGIGVENYRIAVLLDGVDLTFFD